MLIEKYKTIQAFEPKTTNAAITSAYVDLKNTITAVSIVNLVQAVGHETEISLYQAKDIKGTDEKILENNVPILANEDVSKSNELIRKSDGVSYTVEKTVKNK